MAEEATTRVVELAVLTPFRAIAMASAARLQVALRFSETGLVFLEDGIVCHAAVGNRLRGIDAMFELLAWPESPVESAIWSRSKNRTINLKWSEVLARYHSRFRPMWRGVAKMGQFGSVVPCLVFLGRPKRESALLFRSVTTIGSICDRHVVLDEDPAGVEAYHGAFVWRNGRLLYVDHGSTTGTLVNKAKIEHTELSPGDCVQIGTRRMLIGCSEVLSSASTSQSPITMATLFWRDSERTFELFRTASADLREDDGTLPFHRRDRRVQIGSAGEGIVIPDPFVAEKAAEFVLTLDGSIFLEPRADDVAVNGAPVVRPVELGVGDVIQVGRCLLKVGPERSLDPPPFGDPGAGKLAPLNPRPVLTDQKEEQLPIAPLAFPLDAP